MAIVPSWQLMQAPDTLAAMAVPVVVASVVELV